MEGAITEAARADSELRRRRSVEILQGVEELTREPRVRPRGGTRTQRFRTPPSRPNQRYANPSDASAPAHLHRRPRVIQELVLTGFPSPQKPRFMRAAKRATLEHSGPSEVSNGSHVGQANHDSISGPTSDRRRTTGDEQGSNRGHSLKSRLSDVPLYVRPRSNPIP